MQVTLVADFAAAAGAFKRGQKLPVSHGAMHHETCFSAPARKQGCMIGEQYSSHIAHQPLLAMLGLSIAPLTCRQTPNMMDEDLSRCI